MWVHVKKFQKAFRQSPDIFVAHAEDAEAGQHDHDSFCEFKGGDGAHAFDVSGIADWRMRDAGMHVVKN
jgi:hypothetical protein